MFIQRAEINALYRKMTALRNQAQQEQEQAATEFEQFQEEIVGFHEFAVEQLESFQQVFDILKTQRQERQVQKEIREQKTIDRFSGRIARLMDKVEEKDKGVNSVLLILTICWMTERLFYVEAAKLNQILNGLKEQITFYDDRFQRISAATGLENPDDIVNKFYLKEEIKLDLEAEIKAKSKQLAEAQQKRVCGHW